MHNDVAGLDDAQIREHAVRRLQKQRAFHTHVLVYVLVNGFLVLMWGIGGPGKYFWPVFPIGVWGIFAAIHAWTAYRPETFKESTILKEMDRMRAVR